VAASAVANKLLDSVGIKVMAFLSAVANVKAHVAIDADVANLYPKILQSPIFCPDEQAEQQMQQLILTAKEQGDSLGGVATFVATGLPVGLGDPVYEKIEANLAKAMMSLPATKGFEIGEGFHAVEMRGSEHNDPFISRDDKITTATNYAGGTLGGITTGLPLIGRVAFKPTSSITKQQTTVTTEGSAQPFAIPPGSRHDPCVAIRGVPCVAAMCSLVLADALLLNRCVR
jgi:chorismate synthase